MPRQYKKIIGGLTYKQFHAMQHRCDEVEVPVRYNLLANLLVRLKEEDELRAKERAQAPVIVEEKENK